MTVLFLTCSFLFASPERVIYLGCALTEEQIVILNATVAVGRPSAVVLLDSVASRPYIKAFLAAYHPDRVIPVGSFPNGVEEVEKALGIHASDVVAWKEGFPNVLWKGMFSRAERVVFCPSEPRRQLLQGAYLAGVLQAPLMVMHGKNEENQVIRDLLSAWETREIVVIGGKAAPRFSFAGYRVRPVASDRAVAAIAHKALAPNGKIQTLVVANPEDNAKGMGGMGALAPWVACQRHAALILTNGKGDNAAELVLAARNEPASRAADTVIWVANLQAILMERRPNPVAGKDPHIEMEPLTPAGKEPYSIASGRLFHEDLAVVYLMLARQHLWAESVAPHKALVVSNPGGGLPLLEMFSRNTAKEMRNAGYETTSLFEDQANKDLVRRLLPDQEIFLWEGHHQTMVKDYEMPAWTEPLTPSLVFLQSCLALNKEEAEPLLRRGALGVVGSSTRTYSASGGAFTLAFFDALMYDQQTLGGALRQAKNYLLAYSLLKEKRLGSNAKLIGANLRSAWAFTLWGDPTMRLPAVKPGPTALPRVSYRLHGRTISLDLPKKPYDKVVTDKYQAQMFPNARLAGLLTKEESQEGQRLVPLLFAEVALPMSLTDQTPSLSSRIPERNWVFFWDRQRKRGYLLVAPRSKDLGELRFRVELEPAVKDYLIPTRELDSVEPNPN